MKNRLREGPKKSPKQKAKENNSESDQDDHAINVDQLPLAGPDEEVDYNEDLNISEDLSDKNNVISPQSKPHQAIMVNVNERAQIEHEHLSVINKLEEHFSKFYHKKGEGHYSQYLSQKIMDTLSRQFMKWNVLLKPPTNMTFTNADRSTLHSFIQYYAAHYINNNSCAAAPSDENTFREKLVAMRIHQFVDTAGNHRKNDFTEGHISEFASKLIHLFSDSNRAHEEFLFPVGEVKTYRDAIDSWLQDLEENAPAGTEGHFKSMAQDLRMRYVLDITAFERDHKGLGPFICALEAKFAEIEQHFKSANAFLNISIQNLLESFGKSSREPQGQPPSRKEKPSANSNQDVVPTESTKKRKHNPGQLHESNKAQKSDSFCNHCGKRHENANTPKCYALTRKHPNANLERGPSGALVPWSQSTEGRRLAAADLKQVSLTTYIDLVGNKIAIPSSIKAAQSKVWLFTFFTLNPISSSPIEYRPTIRGIAMQDGIVQDNLHILLDSGANANFIKEKLSFASIESSPMRVILADGTSFVCNKICILNNLKLSYASTSIIIDKLYCIVTDSIPSDIVLGLPTIREHRLTQTLSAYWTPDVPPNSSLSSCSDLPSGHQQASLSNQALDTHPSSAEIGLQPIPLNDDNSSDLLPIVTDTHNLLDTSPSVLHNVYSSISPETEVSASAAVESGPAESMSASRLDETTSINSLRASDADPERPIRLHKSHFVSVSEDDDGIPESESSLPYQVPEPSERAIKDRVKIEGPPTLVEKLRAFMDRPEIQERFATSTSKNAALIDPWDIEVNRHQWENARKNRQPTRRQALEKEQALKQFLDNAIEDGVIEPSDYPFWSQVFMVKKKNGKWRICIDFRNLNAATVKRDWPIPRIDALLHRIGSNRPKFFAVCDLTSGYFQCPIGKATQNFTTFATPFGNYKWTRLPMGPTTAPAHFQKQMVTKVFWREIHRILEVYLDDLIVWGNSEEEFMERLETTFKRLIAHRLTLNPDKCVFGVSSVEYLGHEIDEHGLRFTPQKLDSVLNFKTPSNHKDMRSFLGLCTYFREHVPQFSSLAAPLHASITPYVPRRPLRWSNSLTEQYELLKQAVYTCETLYFPRVDGKFVVETDASQLGIGAALFQESTEEGQLIKRPIAFMSRALTRAQRRWATIEQEAYAIYVALKSWTHFLRDTHFILKTDHRNLTFLEADSNDKVRRWKLEIQHFDFDIEWVQGSRNEVADTLSRQFPVVHLNALTSSEVYHYFTGPINFGASVKQMNAYDVLKAFHNATIGHLGVDATMRRLKDRQVSWTGMEDDVRAFIRYCPTCQKTSDDSHAIQSAHYSTSSSQPMTRLNIDTIGPLPIDKEGYTYVIVVIDTFTRFVELYKAKDATSMSAARALLDHIGRYGFPREILTDNGPQYYSELIEHLTYRLGIRHLFTVPYSHEENSTVERANKEVGRHLRAMIMDKRVLTRWSEVLPLVQRIINSKRHVTTGVAPASLIFGGLIDLDRELLPAVPTDASAPPPSASPEYVDFLVQAQNVLMSAAAKEQDRHKEQRRERKRTVVTTQIPIGSQVLVLNGDGQRKSKLQTRYLGPYKVLSLVPAEDTSTPPEYVLLNPVTNKQVRAGLHRLKPFHLDSQHVNPLEVALTDDERYIIESIVDHSPKYDEKRLVKIPKKDLRFLVKYVGYPVPEWNNWDNLYDNALLHLYLRSKNLTKLIHKDFR